MQDNALKENKNYQLHPWSWMTYDAPYDTAHNKISKHKFLKKNAESIKEFVWGVISMMQAMSTQYFKFLSSYKILFKSSRCKDST